MSFRSKTCLGNGGHNHRGGGWRVSVQFARSRMASARGGGGLRWVGSQTKLVKASMEANPAAHARHTALTGHGCRLVALIYYPHGGTRTSEHVHTPTPKRNSKNTGKQEQVNKSVATSTASPTARKAATLRSKTRWESGALSRGMRREHACSPRSIANESRSRRRRVAFASVTPFSSRTQQHNWWQ